MTWLGFTFWSIVLFLIVLGFIYDRFSILSLREKRINEIMIEEIIRSSYGGNKFLL